MQQGNLSTEKNQADILKIKEMVKQIEKICQKDIYIYIVTHVTSFYIYIKHINYILMYNKYDHVIYHVYITCNI